MQPLTRSEIETYYRTRVPGFERATSHGNSEDGSTEIRVPCPIHGGGDRRSLAINLESGVWHCHACGKGGSPADFEMALKGGGEFKDAAASVEDLVGKERPATIGSASYVYVDEDGNPLVRVNRGMREGKKTFWQEHWENGKWERGAKGVRRVPYHLDEVAFADDVIIVEGEKDADALRALGYTATTALGGSSGWRPEHGYAQFFAGKRVVIIPDNDEPGEKYCAAAAADLRGVAISVKVLKLPDLGPAGDASDWLAAGGTRKALDELLDTAEIWVPRVVSRHTQPNLDADIQSQPQTESGYAERLIAVYGHMLRWVHEKKAWMIYDGRRWEIDHIGRAKGFARDVARMAYSQYKRQLDTAKDADQAKLADQLMKDARKAESGRYINQMLSLAQGFGLGISINDFDRGAYLLNCANGTLDLLTGELRPHSPADLIAKMTPINYDPGARCPTFMSELERAMAGSREDIGFLQRAAGLSLSGDVADKAVFVLIGETNAGKTTFLRAIRGVLGDYAGTVKIESLISGAVDNNAQDDLGDLIGKRYVTSSEADSNQRLSAKIKFLTQGAGTPIKSVKKYESHIEFVPTHKLFIDTNDLPRVASDDGALWKRLKPIKFNHPIPDDQIDEHFGDALEREGAGILAWCVRGFQEWQARGLGESPMIDEQRAEWRSGCDPLSEFIADNLTIDLEDAEQYVPVSKVREIYDLWSRRTGERFPLSRAKFNKALEERGLYQSLEDITDKNSGEKKRTRVWKCAKLGIIV